MTNERMSNDERKKDECEMANDECKMTKREGYDKIAERYTGENV